MVLLEPVSLQRGNLRSSINQGIRRIRSFGTSASPDPTSTYPGRDESKVIKTLAGPPHRDTVLEIVLLLTRIPPAVVVSRSKEWPLYSKSELLMGIHPHSVLFSVSAWADKSRTADNPEAAVLYTIIPQGRSTGVAWGQVCLFQADHFPR